ncbi:hypothetical protein PF011_g9990, partial [Phytophthora fragariae]
TRATSGPPPSSWTGCCVQLEAFNEVVKEIAADPSCLTPKLLQELPKALAACRYAILLREHVAAFFPDDDEGQTGHQFFLELLQSWHRSLKTVDVAREELAAVELDNVMFENYYEVLQVDEDFFPDEGKFEVEPEAPKTAKVDRERLFEEAFADELRMELVYLFMELDELLEGVYKVYCEVKQETRTMVEATVVVKLALDTASALTAELQLKYPTLRSAKDMFNIVRNISQKSFRQRILQLHQSIMDELRAAYDSEEDKAVKYVPGTFLIELLGVGTTLDSFVASIPADSNNASGIFFPSGIFGETYGEDRTQLYVLLPDTNNDKVFLMQQLPMLFNAMADRRNAGKSGIELAPMEPFMLLMEKFFSTREVTIPVCFACICWMKSVAALQGRGGLGRNISLTYKHSTELMKNMDAAVESNKALLANNLLRRCASEIKQSTAFRHVGRANPLFAGFLMMNHHFQYLHIANEVIFSTPLLRAFGHLYNALVQEGYLEHIPFFDEVLKVYAQEIFTPSRAAATHGGYYRTYLLSSNLRASAIDAVYRGENFPVGSEAYKKRKAFHLSDVSKIFRLMRLNDKSVLSGGSWKARLEAVSDVCSKELFETRVLSRDLLKLNEDLMDTFPELIKVVGRQDDFKETVAHSVAGESRQQRVNRALEESVMKFLMPFLDAMQSDGSLDTSAIPGGVPATISLDALFAADMCREVAAVIKAKFASPAQICEQKYFTLPSQPNFAAQEYGRLEEGRTDDYEEVFEELMDLLRKSNGPLTGNDLGHFKYEIKRDPDLMGLISGNPEPGVDPMYGDLCSLLHQVAAGPAHDADLVDWMIQMGALIIQPALHCRKAPLQKDLKCPRQLYPNTMALHNAAIAGYEDIVRVILEGDNMVDLNTPTFHTKDTLAHLAVKNGHWGLFCILQTFGADLRIKDGKGRSVSQVTSNKEWARKIAAGTAQYDAFDAINAGKLNARVNQQDSATAELLRQFMAAQHDQKGLDTRGSTGMNTEEGKKSKKKGKRSKKGGAEEQSIIAAAAAQGTTEVETARVLLRLLDAAGSEVNEDHESESLPVLEDKLRKLSVAIFARLRDPNISASKKTRDTHDACRLIKELRSLVKTFSEPSKLNSARHHIRLVIAAEAVHGIHLMQKLYRAQDAAITVVELTPVRQLCETTQLFTKFVVGTARLCVSVDRAPQAREILDVLEKRFLKTPFDKRVPSEFRELVQMYSTAREEMGLGQTSSAKTLRSLEWYLTSAVDNYNVQLTLDGLAGRPVYFEIRPAASVSDKEVLLLTVGVNVIIELKAVACLGGQDKRIIYGGTSKADLARVRAMVLRVAERLEVPLDTQSMNSCTASVHVGGFEFSSAGILRNAPAS